MRRGLLAAVLICAFVVLAAYYYANVTYHLDVPRESEVSTNYEAYVGRNVTISGEVVSTGAGSFELMGAQDTYTVFSTAAGHPGDQVTVVGTLEPGHELRAVTTYTSSWVLSALVYVRSFIALIFVAALFFAGWRFDGRGWVMRPRKPEPREQDGA
jgi:membrane protein implicated in regulation of membrane protease activity